MTINDVCVLYVEHGEDAVSAADAGDVGCVHPFITGCHVFQLHVLWSANWRHLWWRSLCQSETYSRRRVYDLWCNFVVMIIIAHMRLFLIALTRALIFFKNFINAHFVCVYLSDRCQPTTVGLRRSMLVLNAGFTCFCLYEILPSWAWQLTLNKRSFARYYKFRRNSEIAVLRCELICDDWSQFFCCDIPLLYYGTALKILIALNSFNRD